MGKLRNEKDLTHSSGTIKTPEKRSTLLDPLSPVQSNIALRRKLWKPLTTAVNREIRNAKIKAEIKLAPIRVEALANKLMEKPFHKWEPELMEEARTVFKDKLPKIIKANEIKHKTKL